MHVPDGTSARIIFETAAGRTLAEQYAGLIGITDALPEDMAENHDHFNRGAIIKPSGSPLASNYAEK